MKEATVNKRYKHMVTHRMNLMVLHLEREKLYNSKKKKKMVVNMVQEVKGMNTQSAEILNASENMPSDTIMLVTNHTFVKPIENPSLSES